MYLNQLTPQNDYLKFIPDWMLDEKIPSEVFSSLGHYLSRDMNIRQYIGFVTGATELQQIVRGELPPDDESNCTWFKTEEVIDVRVFFRHSKNDPSKTIGSKMRIYSMGVGYNEKKRGGNKQTVQSIDSGFLTSSMGGSDISMIYQNALASTMLHKGLYCIGGAATIRKINVPADDAPSYKWISSIRPAYTENFDRTDFTHILSAACKVADVDEDVIGQANLDALLDMFLTSRTAEEMKDRLADLPDIELYDEDIEEIFEASNNDSANLAKSEDFYDAPGLNVVQTMKILAGIMSE